ncbi:MAG: serine hydrolase domain-containing protein [Clostridia bacterium]
MWDQVEELLERGIAEGAFPGCAMAAGQREQVLYTGVHGYLSQDKQRKVSAATRYDVGALTQVLVAVPLLLYALERGLVSADDPLSAFERAVPQDKKDITLHNLLTHTAGMTPFFLLPQEAENAHSALHALLKHPLANNVGAKVRDSAMGYLLLGFLLEKILNMPLDEAVKRFLCTPLSLAGTGFLPSGEDVAPTNIQSDSDDRQAGSPYDENARFLHGVSGHAGLFTNLNDLSRFASMLACNGHTQSDVFLSPRAIHLATTERTRGLNEARGYGFHIAKRSDPFLGHLWPSESYGLSDPATGSLLAVSPADGFFMVLLTNAQSAPQNKRNTERIHKLLCNAAYAAFQHQNPTLTQPNEQSGGLFN